MICVRFIKSMPILIHQTRKREQNESASEYVRDLIRRDYQRLEERKWSWFMDQLRPGMEADESEFVPFDPEGIIRAAKNEKAGNAP